MLLSLYKQPKKKKKNLFLSQIAIKWFFVLAVRKVLIFYFSFVFVLKLNLHRHNGAQVWAVSLAFGTSTYLHIVGSIGVWPNLAFLKLPFSLLNWQDDWQNVASFGTQLKQLSKLTLLCTRVFKTLALLNSSHSLL